MLIFAAHWPRSLMDRMEDSGSSDRGSNPFGVTNKFGCFRGGLIFLGYFVFHLYFAFH